MGPPGSHIAGRDPGPAPHHCPVVLGQCLWEGRGHPLIGKGRPPSQRVLADGLDHRLRGCLADSPAHTGPGRGTHSTARAPGTLVPCLHPPCLLPGGLSTPGTRPLSTPRQETLGWARVPSGRPSRLLHPQLHKDTPAPHKQEARRSRALRSPGPLAEPVQDRKSGPGWHCRTARWARGPWTGASCWPHAARTG